MNNHFNTAISQDNLIKLLIGQIMVLAILLSLNGCSHDNGLNASKGIDTLKITYVFNTFADVEIFAWPSDTGDTVYSFSPPEIMDLTFRPLQIPATMTVVPRYYWWDGVFSDTTYLFIGNGSAGDTVVVVDTAFDCVFDTIFIPFSPDSASRYLRETAPYFLNGDSLKQALDTLYSGYELKYFIHAMRLPYDSAHILALHAPGFISMGSDSNNGHNIIGWMDTYTDSFCCIGCSSPPGFPTFPIGYGLPITPIVIAHPDTGSIDSTYAWQLIIVNKYGNGDTLNVSTTVLNYQQHVNCGGL
jgi:hypothetical protein